MLSEMQKTACALAVLATTSLPTLANTVDLYVTGSITPAACTPTVSAGGTVDYGAIRAESLNKDAYTVLEEKELTFSISCNAPTKVAVQVINGQPGTSAGSTIDTITGANVGKGPDLFGQAYIARAGLGLADNSAKIGGYALRFVPDSYTTDTGAVSTIQRNDLTSDWKESVGSVFSSTGQRQVTWATPGTMVPVSFQTLNGKLGVQAFINKTSELDTSQPIRLDGKATLELIYL